MLNNEYCKRVYEQILARDPDQKEFHQAVYEVLEGLEPMVERRPELEKNGILERFVEPERVVTFRVPWTDDAGQVHVNRGYRVQFNSAIGPYKGGEKHCGKCGTCVERKEALRDAGIEDTTEYETE